jgi:hypothetical protein
VATHFDATGCINLPGKCWSVQFPDKCNDRQPSRAAWRSEGSDLGSRIASVLPITRPFYMLAMRAEERQMRGKREANARPDHSVNPALRSDNQSHRRARCPFSGQSYCS